MGASSPLGDNLSPEPMPNRDVDLGANCRPRRQVDEVEALQALTLRILSQPGARRVIAQYGASQAQQQSLYRLLDNLAGRISAPERERATYAYFQVQFAEIFPRQEDKAFMDLVVDTLRAEQPLYRDLHAYMAAQGWVK
jgi:hypothetical protein